MSFVIRRRLDSPRMWSFDREELMASRLAELARRDTALNSDSLGSVPYHYRKEARAPIEMIGYLGSSEAAVAGLSLIDDNSSPPCPLRDMKQIEATFS